MLSIVGLRKGTAACLHSATMPVINGIFTDLRNAVRYPDMLQHFAVVQSLSAQTPDGICDLYIPNIPMINESVVANAGNARLDLHKLNPIPVFIPGSALSFGIISHVA